MTLLSVCTTWAAMSMWATVAVTISTPGSDAAVGRTRTSSGRRQPRNTHSNDKPSVPSKLLSTNMIRSSGGSS
ncbi:Uncharacterised protein [Mycobacterium tuberculosis]|nr:Uncharacterised protein [Mycobacterium tuberculosis]CKR74315.1 Uncharacterised protein [Mycobacterium tuberculosis]COW50776.1 Uncharacterised protein [Mycobacterium tuberculosis]SGO56970.1 Uncharacterised protein [Mycobacterium tuberculosis]